MGTGGPFPGAKALPGCEYIPIPPLPPSTFVECCGTALALVGYRQGLGRLICSELHDDKHLPNSVSKKEFGFVSVVQKYMNCIILFCASL
jgi:hypothetical protein